MAVALSLVVASFNQARSLRLVLRGVLGMSELPHEVLVADDGSEAESEGLVHAFAERAPFPVRFVSQENRGFRKARAQNNALRVAKGDLVAFLDGDTIPHRHWLSQHRRALEHAAGYATGGYVHLSMEQAEALESDGSPERFLTEEKRRQLRGIHRRNNLYRLLRRRDKPKILGGNWSVTRESLWRVNGFDEYYEGFGKEESDIRNRLNAVGARGVSVWDRAFVFHCPHELDPGRQSVRRVPPDRAYYASRKRFPRCAHGIVREPEPSR
jgi:glycosyltransferase involved in cell wall biosynthesis